MKHNLLPLKRVILSVLFFFSVFCLEAAVAPAISSFSPESGETGTIVTISGSNFNTTASNNVVLFGSTKATITSATSTSLTVIVPMGSMYQNISVTDISTKLSAYSSKPFITTFSGESKFASKWDYFSGSYLFGITVCDVDLDGNLDVVGQNVQNGKFTVLKNNGNGAFKTKVEYSSAVTSVQQYILAMGDLNGDTYPDVAIADNKMNINSIFILLNNGDGTYANYIQYPTDYYPTSICIADVNMDGMADIVTNSESVKRACVSLNKGNGVFGTFTLVDFGQEVSLITLADVNADGKPDLIANKSKDGLISIFLNNGSGFDTGVDYPGVIGSYTIKAGDLNGDNYFDLVLLSPNENKMYVLMNDGSAAFNSKTEYTTGLNPSDLAIGDINGDGKVDIAITNKDDKYFSIFTNDGSGNFSSRKDYLTPIYGTYISIADLNDDNKPDIATFSSQKNILSITKMIITEAPSISSISPLSGPIGTSVTISGEHFNTSPANNIVFFGAVQANVSAATENALTVTVPMGVTHDKITVTDKTTNRTAYYAQPFITTFENGSTYFEEAGANTTGGGARLPTVYDLNGDGKPDVLVPNSTANTVSVFINNGGGTFATKVDYATGAGPNFVAIEDVNGDGYPDMLVSNKGAYTISILLNDGSGVFGTKTDINIDAFPNFIATNDFNADGLVDIAISTQSSKFIILMNEGNGLFSSPVSYTAAPGFKSLVINDFNNDTYPDIAVPTGIGNLTLYFNNTAGQFDSSINYATIAYPLNVAIGDFNGDQFLDLLVASNQFGSVHLNNGSNDFSSKTDYLISSNNINSITIADINGDGFSDFIAGSEGANFVFKNTGTGTFVKETNFYNYTHYLAVADVTGDGKPDLVSTNSLTSMKVWKNTYPTPTITSFTPLFGTAGNSITITGTNFNTTASNNIVYFGPTKASVITASATSLTVTVPVGASYSQITVTDTISGKTATSPKKFYPTFTNGGTFEPKVDMSVGAHPNSLATGDFNWDGKVDVAVLNKTSNTVSIYLNNGNAVFAPKIDYATGANPSAVTTGDFNGDGSLDLAITNYDDNTFSILLNKGNAVFEAKTDYITSTNPVSVGAADINKDGFIDLAIANEGSNNVSIFYNNDGISFNPKIDYATGTKPCFVTFGDLNNDTYTDLVVANKESNTISRFIYNGNSFNSKIDFNTGSGPSSLIIADLDNDGTIDIVVVNSISNTLSIFKNGSSTKLDRPTGIEPTGIILGDVDGNSGLDLFVTNKQDATVSVFYYAGGAICSSRFDYETGNNPMGIAMADFNEDGKSDLLVANNGSNSLSLLKNTLAPMPTISSFTPNSGAQGDTITITGTNFTAVKEISFGNTSATSYTSVSPTEIKAVVAGGTSGYVKVITVGGTASLAGFKYLLPQTITFNPFPTVTYGDAPFIATANGGSSGKPVILSSSDTTIATCTGTNGRTITVLKAGTCNILANQAGDNIYAAATQASQALVISPKALTVTADANQQKIYGDSDPLLTYSLSPSLLGSDALSGALSRDAGEDVGLYEITLGTLSNPNYSISLVVDSLSIVPKAITVTANEGQYKVLGDSDPELTYSISPSLVGVDTLSGSLTREAGETIGFYAIQQGSLAANANYILSYVSKDFEISKPIVRIKANAQSKVYGDTDPSLSYTISGFLDGDDEADLLSPVVINRTPGENVGKYPIQTSGATSDKYKLVFETDSLQITPMAITISADAGKSKVYGESDPVLTYAVNPALIGSDVVSGTLTRNSGENVGSYPILKGTLSIGSNYTLTYTGSNLSIQAASLVASAEETYRPIKQANPTFVINYSGFVNGDTESVLTSAPIATCMADANSSAGDYPVLISGGVATNYIISGVNGILHVTPFAGDKDGNGKIESPEIAGDNNCDGTITLPEIAGDLDGDGTITSPEIAGDINGDKTIDNGEIAGDTNGDKTISTSEIAGDTNGDKTINNDEIAGDTNGDKQITDAEKSGDTNGDGSISSPEKSGDVNGDNQITGSEIAGDKNGDKTINNNEVAGDSNGDGGITSPEIAGDKNGDGTISAPEIAGDTNGDGTIDGEEVTGDTNGDNKITDGEITGDKNGDGTISTPEIAGDKNGDNQITDTEIAGDKNGDKTIDNGEIAGDTNGDKTISTPEIAGDINGDKTINNDEVAGDSNGDKQITDAEKSGDTNGDGSISSPEKLGDVNGDNQITGSEIAGDKNGDKTINNNEISGDSNGDGAITDSEIAGDKNGDHVMNNGELAGDTNGDGEISGAEYGGDSNGDGTITSPELSSDINANRAIDPSEISDIELENQQVLVPVEGGCQGENLYFAYKLISGNPHEYQIIFDSNALTAGFQNVNYSALLPSGQEDTLYVSVPANVKEGSYHARIKFRNNKGIESISYDVEFAINLSKAIIIPKYNDVLICDNSMHQFVSYQWYKDGVIIDGATKQFYNDKNGLVGNYYLTVQTAEGKILKTCSQDLNRPASKKPSFKVYPNPVKANETFTLTISGYTENELQGAVISIFNVQGSLIRTLSNVSTSNVLDLPAGNYVCTLKTVNNAVYSFKIIVAY